MRSSLVIDGASGEAIVAKQPRRLNAPASLTKLMTAYLVLEAFASGKLAPTTVLKASARAAKQPPSRLGLSAGASISAEDALQALIVRSANDAAVVLAETVSGSVEIFVRQMNAKATALNMSATRFRNPSGLPASGQVTTANDMARLARALLNAFPKQLAVLSAREFDWAGSRLTRGHPLFREENVRLLKTGFTCRAGYSLAAAVKRGQTTAIVVVLGATAPSVRDGESRRITQAAFRDPSARPAATADYKTTLNTTIIAHNCRPGHAPLRYVKANRWSVELDITTDAKGAVKRSLALVKRLRIRRARPWLVPEMARSLAYRAGVTGLSQQDAMKLCTSVRGDNKYCVVRPPALGEAISTRGQQALQFAKERGIALPK